MSNSNTNNWLPGNGNLLKTELQHQSGARAEIYQHGSHLTSWEAASGKQWIFTSERAVFERSGAIRGGVPIIFPQFNAFGDGPRHGFARNLEWRCTERGDNSVTMLLEAGEGTRAWPHHFQAEFCCTLGASDLNMRLKVTNLEKESFQFTCALHTYFRIEGLASTRVEGLQGLSYWDNDGSAFDQRRPYDKNELAFDDAVDRVFFDYQRPLVLQSGSNSLTIEHSGFEDIVIWNPGREAAKTMVDFADHEYDQMLCIEAAQIDKPVVLQPGESWQGSQFCQDSSNCCAEDSC